MGSVLLSVRDGSNRSQMGSLGCEKAGGYPSRETGHRALVGMAVLSVPGGDAGM